MNNVIPSQPAIGARDGSWVWDGTRWVCVPDCDNPPGPCPPFSVLQPGGPQHSPFFPPPVTQPPWYPGANGGVSFSPPGQAPPNPIRGAFWWDGTTLRMFDGAAWVLVGGTGGSSSGPVTPPSTTQPANPVPGQQWFNGTTLFVWDGNAWVPVSQTKTYIQATAPPSPNPGDLWFDGTQMRIWSGSAWQLVGPGATVGPVATTTIAFAMTATTNKTIAGTPANWGIVGFNDAPLTDTFSGWDPVTHKYQPNRAGIYLFSGRSATIGTGGGGIALLKNDPGTFANALGSDLIVGIASNATGGWATFNGVTQLNGSTDYVRMWAWAADSIYHNAGSNPVYIGTILP